MLLQFYNINIIANGFCGVGGWELLENSQEPAALNIFLTTATTKNTANRGRKAAQIKIFSTGSPEFFMKSTASLMNSDQNKRNLKKNPVALFWKHSKSRE